MSDFGEFQKGVAACEECSAFKSKGYWKFPPEVHGEASSDVWIMGSNPRRIDENLQDGGTPLYWMGRSAQNIRHPLEAHLGRTLEEMVYLTDAVKCQSEGKPPSEALGKCPKLWLEKEIEVLRPKAILAVGKAATEALAHCQDVLARLEIELVQLPHPSPANGREIRSKYAGRGWSAYRSDVVEIVARWLQ